MKRDTNELEDLSDKLKKTLLKLRDYQERVLVLEESSDMEARQRLESDQTMDLLKVSSWAWLGLCWLVGTNKVVALFEYYQLEVEKLRKLVRKQKEEMDVKDQEEHKQFKLELERLQQQLRGAQEELLGERRDRIQEKQRELDERLARSMVNMSTVVSESPLHVNHKLSNEEVLRTQSLPQLDMSSFLNTSIELPEKIKEIMDEWKQRMEDAIAGTVKSISDPSRKACDSEVGAAGPRAENTHGDSEQDDDEDVDGSSADEEEVPDGAPSYQNERGTRSHRSQQGKSHFATRHRKLGLEAVPKVNRLPFDKYISIESEVESEEGGGRDDEFYTGDVDYEGEAEEVDDNVKYPRRNEAWRNRRERTFRASGRPSHHHRSRTFEETPRSENGRQTHNYRRARCGEGEARHALDRDHDIFEEDDDFSDGRGRGVVGHRQDEGGRHRNRDDSKIALMDSISNQSFTFVNGFENGHKTGMNTSFSSLYETALFDVVDAMEGATASTHESGQAPVSSWSCSPSHRHNDLSQTSRGNQLNGTTPDIAPPGNGADASPSTRLKRLVQGMEARERKLARLGGHHPSLHILTTHNQQHASPGELHDARADDDFDIFNDVKDIYEKELLESRQHQGSGATAWTTNGGAHGPPLSQQDLSVREAIEKEMAELLQEEAFQHLLH